MGKSKAAERRWLARRGRLFRELVERDGPGCYVCRSAPATTIDHVWPVRLGGSDHPYNLRLACRPCNSKKRCSPPDVLPLFVDGDPWREWERYQIERRYGSLVNQLKRGTNSLETWIKAREVVLAELIEAGFDGFSDGSTLQNPYWAD